MSRSVRLMLSGLSRGQRELPRPSHHYLCVVHRLEAGAEFLAFDPEAALECDATIVRADRRSARVELAEPRVAKNLGGLGVTLLQAVGKGDKPEEVVRVVTALGALAVTFVSAERSVARPTAERTERLKSVAIEAARQSGRGDLPKIDGPVSLAVALEGLGDNPGARLCLDPGAPTPLAERLFEPAVLLIGPEGGFSNAEREVALAAGFERVALGPLTLRTELAAAAALGCFAGLRRGTPA